MEFIPSTDDQSGDWPLPLVVRWRLSLTMLASRDIDPLPLVVSGTNTPHIHGQKTTSFIGGQWEKWPLNTKKLKKSIQELLEQPSPLPSHPRWWHLSAFFFRWLYKGGCYRNPPHVASEIYKSLGKIFVAIMIWQQGLECKKIHFVANTYQIDFPVLFSKL